MVSSPACRWVGSGSTGNCRRGRSAKVLTRASLIMGASTFGAVPARLVFRRSPSPPHRQAGDETCCAGPLRCCVCPTNGSGSPSRDADPFLIVAGVTPSAGHLGRDGAGPQSCNPTRSRAPMRADRDGRDDLLDAERPLLAAQFYQESGFNRTRLEHGARASPSSSRTRGRPGLAERRRGKENRSIRPTRSRPPRASTAPWRASWRRCRATRWATCSGLHAGAGACSRQRHPTSPTRTTSRTSRALEKSFAAPTRRGAKR